MRRQSILTTLCLLLACAATLAHAADGAKPEPAFLERTVVYYPKAIGDYTLVDSGFDPAHWTSGLGLRYAIADAPVVLDIFVYPHGRMPPADAMARGLKEVEEGVREQERLGTYRDVRFAEVDTFPVPLPLNGTPPNPPPARDDSKAPTADTPTAPGATPADEEKSRIIVEMLDQLGGNPSATLEGRRRAIALLHGEEPRQSLAYLFYRQLYLVKVRASAPLAAGSDAAFVALVDKAVRTLVPAIEIHHEGACGNAIVYVPEAGAPADAGAADTGKQMMSELVRVQREGCAASLGKLEPPAGFGQQEIRYPPDTWKSE